MRTATLFFLLLLHFGAAATVVTFQVDMRGLTVAPTGVHVAGNFQAAAGFGADWNPATTALFDANADGIYELSLTVPEGTYLYKFVNGTMWAESEIVPLTCGLPDGGGNVNRQIGVALSGVQQMPALAFGGCAPNAPLVTTYDTHWWNDAVFYELKLRRKFLTSQETCF